MPIPTGVRTHTAARAGPGSPLSNTLEKQNRQPVELCLQPAPRTGNTVGARVGKGRQRAAPARPPPREGREPSRPGGGTYSEDPARAPLRSPDPAARSPLSAPRPDSAASGGTTASPPGRPPSPARPALTSGVLERDIYGQETLNFP